MTWCRKWYYITWHVAAGYMFFNKLELCINALLISKFVSESCHHRHKTSPTGCRSLQLPWGLDEATVLWSSVHRVLNRAYVSYMWVYFNLQNWEPLHLANMWTSINPIPTELFSVSAAGSPSPFLSRPIVLQALKAWMAHCCCVQTHGTYQWAQDTCSVTISKEMTDSLALHTSASRLQVES